MLDSPAKTTLAPRETGALRRWATIAGVALIVLIIVADTYEGWQDYRRVIADNERLQTALSRALTEQTARMVQEVDVVLTDYAGWLESAAGRAADKNTMIARLNAQIVSLPFVSSAAVVDRNGELRVDTNPDESAARSLKNLEIFTVPQHAGDDALFVDRPAGGSARNPQTFALSRRLNSTGNAFDGVVVARVAFEYLAGFYAGVSVNPDTSIRLLRSDGTTLIAYPSLAAGATSLARTRAARVLAAKDQITYGLRQGHEEIQVSQQVAGYPILVSVSRPVASVLQPWIVEERSSALRTLSLAVLATLLLTALRAALKRQADMDAERDRLELELAAIQRVEALGFLAASVAHDFNNVLTAIIGYAELTREMVEGQPAALVHVDRLLAASERARLLVRRVLTFDPRRTLRYGPMSIEPIVLEVSQQVRATLPTSIDMRVRAPTDSPAVLGDPTEIHQVLTNLCSNAVHAMPSGGTLEIRLETLEVGQTAALAVGELTAGPWVCLSVIDSGVGLAPEQVRSIFEPFYTTRQTAHGTGIGLTVVRNIILRTHGALSVDSRVGAGTTMTVYWPGVVTPGVVTPGVVTPGAATRGIAPPAAASHAGGAGETILVIDDEHELVALTEELLASLGYEPVGFSDPRAALEAVRSEPGRFDAILTDERMQSLRGLEFAALVHAIAPQLPIIMMTGHRDAEIDARAEEVGIVQILDKPLRVQTLRDALARELRRVSIATKPAASDISG